MALKKCIECGEQFEATLSACPNCGCPADAILLCPECGTSFDAALDACPECGCPKDAFEELTQPMPEPIVEEKAPVIKDIAPAIVEPAPIPAPEPVQEGSLEEQVRKAGLYACEECGEFYPLGEKVCPECGCPTSKEHIICPECEVAYDAKLLECPNCGCINETIDASIIQQIAEKDQEELKELEQEKRIIEEHMLLNLRHAAKGADVSNSVIKSLARSFLRFDNFSGRARRSEFWIFVAFNTIIGFILCAILLACMGRDYITISLAQTETEYLYRLFNSCLTQHLVITSVIILYLFIITVPFISLTVRRLHDTNRSGLWLMLGIVPFILGCMFNFSPFWGIALLAIMLLLDSVPDNKWGRAPHRA